MLSPARDEPIADRLVHDEVTVPGAVERAVSPGERRGGGKAVPGSFSLAVAGHSIAVHVEAAAGRVRIEIRLPAALAELSVAAVDEGGADVGSPTHEGRKRAWVVAVKRGKTRVLLARGDQAWAFDVTV